MDRSEFAKSMAFLAASVGREMPRATAEAWFQICGDMDAIDLQRGIVHALREHTFAGFPAIGQILKHARPAAIAVDAETRALAAWEGLLATIRSVGGYATVRFDDAAVAATVRALGGWVRLTEQTTDDLTRFIRPQFVQTYKSLLAVGVRAEAAEPLPGLVDIENSKAGFRVGNAVDVRLNLPGPAARIQPGLVHPPMDRLPSGGEIEQAGPLFLTVAERTVS